jgi:hypothetical protein
MRWGLAFGVVLILVTIAVIVALCLRPATVIGVSEESLAASVKGDEEVSAARCKEVRTDERFVCAVALEGSSPGGPEAVLRIEVDDLGCWESTNPAPSGQRPDGCITITDLIRSGDARSAD